MKDLYKPENIFNRVLKREMKVLMDEKSKSCQSGAIIDIATDRVIEAYAMLEAFKESESGKQFLKDIHQMEKSERERYQGIVEKYNKERAK